MCTLASGAALWMFCSVFLRTLFYCFVPSFEYFSACLYNINQTNRRRPGVGWDLAINRASSSTGTIRKKGRDKSYPGARTISIPPIFFIYFFFSQNAVFHVHFIYRNTPFSSGENQLASEEGTDKKVIRDPVGMRMSRRKRPSPRLEGYNSS